MDELLLSQIAGPAYQKKASARQGKVNDGVPRRTCAGRFRLFQDGMITGVAYVNLVHKRKWVCNVNFVIYDKGRWPWFREKDKDVEGTINLPLPFVLKLSEIIRKKGFRVRKRDDHKWWIKNFKGEKRLDS